jgi:hypothetical protein
MAASAWIRQRSTMGLYAANPLPARRDMRSVFLASLTAFVLLLTHVLGAAQDASSPSRQTRSSEIQVSVPTKLRIERSPGVVSVKVDQDSLESIKVTTDEGMVNGIKSELRVYPAGESRPPVPDRWGLKSGTDFDLGADRLNAKDPGFPVPRRKYVIEVVVTLFETDIQPHHMWRPLESKKYKVLWQRALVETIE